MSKEKKKDVMKSQMAGFMGAFDDNEPASSEPAADKKEAPTAQAQDPNTHENHTAAPTEILAVLKSMQDKLDKQAKVMEKQSHEISALKEEKAERQKQERKTKRINLLLKPSVYKVAIDAAQGKQLSFNEFAERALLAYAQQLSKE